MFSIGTDYDYNTLKRRKEEANTIVKLWRGVLTLKSSFNEIIGALMFVDVYTCIAMSKTM